MEPLQSKDRRSPSFAVVDEAERFFVAEAVEHTLKVVGRDAMVWASVRVT